MLKRYLLCILLITISFVSCKNRGFNDDVFIEGGEYDFSKVLDTNLETVSVKSFYISRYKVTRKEYENFLKENSYKEYSSNSSEYSLDVTMPKSDCPAMFVSFYDACEFCNYLSSKHNFQKVYDLSNLPEIKTDNNANGYRLPSKNEWFYAFFGGKESLKNKWWENISYSDYIYDCFAKHISVGTLKPKPLKLYDMLGNGLEWTGTEIHRDNLNNDLKYAFVVGTGIPGNKIQDYDSLTDFLKYFYMEEPVAKMEDELFYIGFRVARNAE